MDPKSAPSGKQAEVGRETPHGGGRNRLEGLYLGVAQPWRLADATRRAVDDADEC